MEPLGRALWPPRFGRRGALKLAALGGVSWLTPVAELLARNAETNARGEPAQSLIFLWLAGGPSQLETFDPHPGTAIAGGTEATGTSVPGVQLAKGYQRLADQLEHVALVRSVISKEGDHERGTYTVKTGYRPNPTVVHPSIGAICCHQLPVAQAEIPRHVSILDTQWPSAGGFLGKQYDAFKCDDPAEKVPDITARVPDPRIDRRLADLNVIESAFSRGRAKTAAGTLHRETVTGARTMMTSSQIAAFEVSREPEAVRKSYGDTPFGRGCLAARRLIEVGVRCVEVNLNGWDSHVNNHEIHARLAPTLDAALAALIADLRERNLLDKTVVLCGGEFGRTPQVNRLDGRDHWPHGFTMLLAGGGIRAGAVIGETDPEGGRKLKDPYEVADVHATVLTALGLDPAHEELAPIGRPIKLSEGKPIRALLA
ncbi:MAG TPA: DUF1501 domain-containing protein [Pirellulales bacterium]|jgi:hypothetical protein|nr:DUF1501 domain-containing protein [Pirellulales bacterium]